jgi:group I intron endonuclease
MIIYKTTNEINEKIYIGQDRYNNPLYIGSGSLLKRAIKKYGVENFKKEIIEFCSSFKELNEREIFWIKELNSTDPNIGYNIAKGGTGGDTISHNPRKKELGQNISFKNKERYKNKINHPQYGKTQTKESNEKRSKTLLGIKRSAETKRKQSLAASGKNNSAYGKKWVCNKTLNKNKLINPDDINKYLTEGWESGIIFKSKLFT